MSQILNLAGLKRCTNHKLTLSPGYCSFVQFLSTLGLHLYSIPYSGIVQGSQMDLLTYTPACQVPPRYLKQDTFTHKVTTVLRPAVLHSTETCTVYRILTSVQFLVQSRTHSYLQNRTGESNGPPNLYSSLSGSSTLPETGHLSSKSDYSFRLCCPSVGQLLHRPAKSKTFRIITQKCCTSESCQKKALLKCHF